MMKTDKPFLLYINANDEVKVDVLLKDEALWLSTEETDLVEGKNEA